MQQTKRRSKKGVILLALALALLVVALVPASALAAPATILINGVAGPVTVGSNSVNVTYHSDNPLATQVSFNVATGIPYTFQSWNESALIPYTPLDTATTSVALGLDLQVGDTFKVRVTFYNASSTSLETVASDVITYDNSKSVSELDWNDYGARGDVVPIAPVPPGPPWADYSTVWFGPGWGSWGAAWEIANGRYQTAQGDFYVFGAPAHSVVYEVDDLYTADLEVDTLFPYTPVVGNPIPFYDITGILTWAGDTWFHSPAVRDGFHWVDHYAVASTGLVDGPIARAPFGWDSLRPRWTVNVYPDVDWHGNAPVEWDAHVTDNPGSGVATATVHPDFSNTPQTLPGGWDQYVVGPVLRTYRLEWTWWQSQASGTVANGKALIPKTNPINPLKWTGTWDANALLGPVEVSFDATDAVDNRGAEVQEVWFDLIAPHTSHTSVPTDATSFVWSPWWTNDDVVVTFHAMDPGAPHLGSGVDYTEYIIGDSMTNVPGPDSVGEHGDSVIIDTNAPTGPVYLWFRSVDNAVPANKEVWQKVYVYIDKAGPLPTSGTASAESGSPFLINDVPAYWINDGYAFEPTQTTQSVGVDLGGKGVIPVVPFLFDFNIWFDAWDDNSGIGPDLIQWRVLNWMGNYGYDEWNQVYPDNFSPAFDVHASWADDGMYTLESWVADRAGNETTLSTPLMIDTKPPSTDGPGYGDSPHWINGLEPYTLTATDQSIGAGVAATVYRVDRSIPWLYNEATTVGTQLETEVDLVPIGGTAVQGEVYTVDFGSVDAALPYDFQYFDWNFVADGPSWVFGNLEGTNWVWDGMDGFIGYNGYKTEDVKLDIIAPEVTAQDPQNGNWQKGPAVINFSGTDVGSGYAYTEYSMDDGASWTQGESAEVGGDGEITVSYRGTDNVGLMSDVQTITVKVATTPPKVAAKGASVKQGHKAKFRFTVTSVTPLASQVIIQIRTLGGRTVMTHTFDNVTANVQKSRSFKIDIKKGKYYIRIGAVDQAGNVQIKRGKAILTVK